MSDVIAWLFHAFGGRRPVLPNMPLITPIWHVVTFRHCVCECVRGLLKWKSRKFLLFISEDRRCYIGGMVIFVIDSTPWSPTHRSGKGCQNCPVKSVPLGGKCLYLAEQLNVLKVCFSVDHSTSLVFLISGPVILQILVSVSE
jgi:hypothetical protein